RELLTLRREHIVPLLSTAGGHSGRVIDTAPGFVAVSWAFPKGTPSLALNIGERPQPLPEMPGDTLFAWPQAGDELPANSIHVRLAKGDAQ
ncbi:DUF3459 domain-containing protein, partial [Cronobacter sakazakii]|uniref:DUF3459 domain-containing protein n=1 Tax=Cronobacter sakazakii TaxID=28141 RepID=UPI000AE128CE